MNGYKIKCLIISTVSIFISHITIGQAPSWNMSQRFGAIANDVSKSISVDAVGNQIIGGSFESNSISFGSILLSKVGGKDIYVAKLSQSGVIVWAKSAGGSGVDEVTSVSTDASNNIIVAGYFNSNTISFGSTILNNKGGTDVFVVKYDPNGNILWAVSAGGAGNDEANSVCTDLSGNVYVTGFYESSTVSFNSETLTNKGGKDIFILKFNNNGVPVSSRTYGDAGNDWGVFLRRNSLNQIFVTGNFVSSTIRFDSFVLNNSRLFVNSCG